MTSTILQNPYGAAIRGKINYSQLVYTKLGSLVTHIKNQRDITYEYITNGGEAPSSSLLCPDCRDGGVV